ncbi:MAG: hypothetical protein ACYC6X_01645 [Minisyncoccota bacterium]
MRRLLSTSFIALSLALSAAGAAHAAIGDSCQNDLGCTAGAEICKLPAPPLQGNGTCVAAPGSTQTSSSVTSPSNYVMQSSQNTTSTAAPIPSTGPATNPNSETIGNTTADQFSSVMTWIATLFAWLVGVAALTLDYTVYYTIVTMGNYVSHLTAIGVAWRVMRDVGNIMLIFGFLAAGISIILNVDLYGWRKMLPKLLIVAVLLNFSLFLSEAVIDVGNLVATQFYTQINGGSLPTPASISQTTVKTEGISNAIMSQLGLATIYPTNNPNAFTDNHAWLIGFMSIILFVITAFVMFSLAFILIARFVYLVFLIIVSPLRVAGFGIPMLEKASQKWLSDLLQQTFIAPVLLLLLYVALAVITDAHFLTGFNATGDWLGYINNDNLTGFGSIILSFFIAMGLLLYITYKAKDLGAVGAVGATKLAGKLTFGATAWAGRTTVGWGSHKAAKYLRGTAFGRVPLVGTGLVKGLNRVATGSFDVRGIKAGGGLKGLGVDAGAAQKGGYQADLKGRIESRTKYASELLGRELTEDEKIDQKVAQDAVKATEKRLAEAQVRQREMIADGRDTRDVDDEISAEKGLLVGYQTKLDKIENVTDKGAQRKYAKVLNFGMDEKSFFNKYINFAANTDAAKKIRKEAKKSSDDKTLEALKKALKKAGKEEEPEKKEEEKKPEEKKPEVPH